MTGDLVGDNVNGVYIHIYIYTYIYIYIYIWYTPQSMAIPSRAKEWGFIDLSHVHHGVGVEYAQGNG